MDAARTFLASLVDYAGLFPPAELQMRSAVPKYAAYREAPYAWLLGRFVLPLAQIDEFERAFDDLPAMHRARPWSLSVLAGRSLQADAKKIVEFNRRHGDEGRRDARIESIELKVHSLDDVAATADTIAEPAEVYFEIGIAADPRDWIAAVRAAGGRAKVRTGGVTAELFPATAHLARFLHEAASERVPFKATAGLHHAVRGEYRVAPDERSGRVVMHGFLNVFLAAALAYSDHASLDTLESVLEDRSGGGFAFDDAGVSVHGCRLNCEDLASARRRFATSYGSCSIDEPVEDLKRLGLL